MNSGEHRRRLLKKWSRTLHIYLSMLGLLGILFFSLTGLLLNHPDWCGLSTPRVTKVEGAVPLEMLKTPDQFAVVEKLRKDFGATGAVDSFEADEDRITVVFKSPARRVQAVIDRQKGRAEVLLESRNAAARLAELHRGVEAGSAWRFILDAIAVLQLVGALTGVLLWCLVPRWRPLGLAALAVCGAACGLVYWFLVP
ncbi:MAG: hypothetical protein FJ398_05540 [Verrucomicrobia bacterium]|nr:hypothetical protein [Verrucomicrobiota bacterium]